MESQKMRTVKIRGVKIGVRLAGDASLPAVVLLHGWPQSSRAFVRVLPKLGEDHFALAFDLPGIGASRGRLPTAEKAEIAGALLDAAESLGARRIVVCGYDVGGMVAYAAARDHASRIVGAMVMNTVLPGIDPWADVLADPRIFHFALHALAKLPERLVAGRERACFDFFYDLLAGDKSAITEVARHDYAQAYERKAALSAGFDWYRAMEADAARNARKKVIEVPILYVRGDADGQRPEDYIPAIRAKGARRVEGLVIPGGEYVAEENPGLLVQAIRGFRRTCEARRPRARSARPAESPAADA